MAENRFTGPLAGALPRGAFGVAAVGLAAFAAYAAIFLPYMPNAGGVAGSDFGYFVPQLMAGFFWYQQNGPFSLPWFNPGICGGVPFYPNMQGLYLSLPQFLTFFMGPIAALRATFLIMAAAGFAGFYALLRRPFGLSRWIALAGATLFLFNGFYAYRFIIGHLTFHPFMLTPLIALAALIRGKDGTAARPVDGWVLIAGLLMGYMVQSGMVHAMPPSLAAVAIIVLAHGMLRGFSAMPWLRLAIAGVVGLALSASKLSAGLAFVELFPREMYALTGFGSVWQSLVIALHSLFLAPAAGLGAEWLTNNLWYAGTLVHFPQTEFEYGVTLIPAFLLLMWVWQRLARRHAPDSKPQTSPAAAAAAWTAIAALLALPVLLNWYQPDWHDFLRRLPLFKNTYTLIRWYCLYVILACFAAALILERAKLTPMVRKFGALAIIAAVIVANARADRSYYDAMKGYDLRPADRVHAAVMKGAPVPAVTAIDRLQITPREYFTIHDRNDGMLAGRSQMACYEPMFGFRLEEFPVGPLRAGATLAARDGLLNIKNPACMVYPDANQCRPGDHFEAGDIERARAFVNYRAFAFEMPAAQKIANGISLAALLAVLAGLLAFGWRDYRRAPARRPARAS